MFSQQVLVDDEADHRHRPGTMVASNTMNRRFAWEAETGKAVTLKE